MIRGVLLSFTDPVARRVPRVVPFQYNAAEVTRVLTVRRPDTAPGLRVAGPPQETWTMTVELDALAAPGRPITATLGIGPMLQTIEAMLEPGSREALAGAVGNLPGAASGAAQPVPAPRLPLVVLAWNLTRVAPVRIDSYRASETMFDANLNPVQASVELSFTVLRAADLESSMTLARTMATTYQALRSTAAAAGLAQGLELSL